MSNINEIETMESAGGEKTVLTIEGKDQFGNKQMMNVKFTTKQVEDLIYMLQQSLEVKRPEVMESVYYQ